MTDKFKSLDKFLNSLLLFLFPSQLALHFWPNFSLVFGIRVDYLSPAIYLTDILFITLFIWWLARSGKVILKDLIRNKMFLIMLLTVIILNIAASANHVVSLIKWVKIIEFLALGYYVYKRRDIFNLKKVARIFFYSLLFFCLVGLLQFINGKTSGQIFYLLGERSFSIYTPGIALANIFGKIFLRPYSTFPHPNSLAGFLGVSLLFLLPNLTFKNKWIKIAGLSLIFTMFILTFSLSAYIGLLVCLLFYLISRKRNITQKHFVIILISIFLASLCLSLFSKTLLIKNPNLPQSFSQRLELADVAGNIFSGNWTVGTGLNTFIVKEIDYAGYISNVWFLQPVHNIYLLIFTEGGVLGIVLLTLLFYKLFDVCVKSDNKWGSLIVLFILVTGLFDHYWFTIQQNLLITSFFFGLILRQKQLS